MFKALKKVLFIIGFSACAAAPVQANLLTNPGFETGTFAGWTVGGVNGGSGVGVDGSVIPGTDSLFGRVVVNVHSGVFAAFGVIANTNGEFLSLSQTVSLGGGAYSAGFFMGNASQAMFGIDNAISANRLAILVDGTVIPFLIRSLGNNFPIGSTAADMREFGIDFNVAAGSHTIEYRISGSGTARAGISVDDFYLSRQIGLVPEPATLALLGLGLAGIAVSRRHKQ